MCILYIQFMYKYELIHMHMNMTIYECTYISELFVKYQTQPGSRDVPWLLDACPSRSVHYPVQ